MAGGERRRLSSRLRFEDVALPARGLIATAAFLREHPLAGGGIFGNAGHAGVKRIALRSGGGAVAAFRRRGSHNGKTECFVIPAAFLCDLPGSSRSA